MERSFRISRDYRLRQLPPVLARRLQEVLMLAWVPATLGELVDSLAARLQRVAPVDLCCQGSRHRVTAGGETTHTRCGRTNGNRRWVWLACRSPGRHLYGWRRERDSNPRGGFRPPPA
jgi:hypothetical protein